MTVVLFDDAFLASDQDIAEAAFLQMCSPLVPRSPIGAK